MNRFVRFVLLSTLVLSSLAAAQASHAFLWTASGGMQDLGVVPGWLDSLGYGIDRSGAVVGCDERDTGGGAFGWTTAGGMRLLQELSLTDSCAAAVNDSGQVVGYSLTKAGVFHAFLWARGAALDLGTLGGPSSRATGINDSGEVVGYSDMPNAAVQHAFLWTQSAGMQDLTTLSGKQCPTCEIHAFAINNDGVIVGQVASNQNVRGYPFIWKNGNLRTLGGLGGVGKNGGGAAMGVNKHGQVVGWALTATGDTHAFLWTKAGGMQDLGTLAGFAASTAQGVNKLGQVVGQSYTGGGGFHAFVWSSQTGMVDIGTLGGSLAFASAINDAGQVTGASTIQ